jgi:hypothetical protein
LGRGSAAPSTCLAFSLIPYLRQLLTDTDPPWNTAEINFLDRFAKVVERSRLVLIVFPCSTFSGGSAFVFEAPRIKQYIKTCSQMTTTPGGITPVHVQAIKVIPHLIQVPGLTRCTCFARHVVARPLVCLLHRDLTSTPMVSPLLDTDFFSPLLLAAHAIHHIAVRVTVSETLLSLLQAEISTNSQD